MPHEACRGVEEIFDGHQAVVFQGATSSDQIHNRLCDSSNRAQFDRSREVNQLHG